MLCRIERGRCRIWSRNGRDWTRAFPTIADAAAKLPVKSAWIDGEIVMPLEGGGTSFQALQNALSENAEGALVYFAFDLPYCDGYDLRGAPLADRKRLLEPLLAGSARIRYSQHFETEGTSMLAEACRRGLEGIVSKRADSPYVATRGRSWVKVKCSKRQEFVIGGFTPGQGSRSGFGALLVGVYDSGELRYAGKVGTGFTATALDEIRAMLDKLRVDEPAFANPPRGAEGRRAIWVKPKLVGEVTFTEWTRDGTLRHPSFQGLRLDKAAKDVVREREKRIASRGKHRESD
jgi:bifunctional non-homologous end joining protein LigD